ncbi:hypothetical protein ACVWYF_003775 [Hymenobacter sp. UYAg731]
MKNLLTACLPALALFALGGCAGTSALTSSEDDGVYYSSKDRTTAIVSTAPAPAAYSEEANPDYNGGSTNSSSARQNNSGSTQYYDNTYTYMRGAPGYGGSPSYYGPGLNSYSPYSPYTSLSYGGGYGGGYAYGGGACGFSPYAYGGYDPFYSSFGSPYGYSPYGYGSGLSISFGFGRSFGYGGYGGYGYSPFGYGGYGGYSPFYYSSPFYGGYYGRSGYYGNSYYGNNYNGGSYYNNGGGNERNPVRSYGHRNSEASDVRYSSGNGGNVPNTTPGTPGGGGRVRSADRVMTNVPETMPMSTADAVGRSRSETISAGQPERAKDAYNQPQGMSGIDQPRYRDMGKRRDAQSGNLATPDQEQIARDNGRGRMRNAEAMPQNNGQMQPQPAAMPQDGQRRRGGFFQNVLGEQPNNSGGQATEQPRQRANDQPQQQRTYDQPRQRTYEQPQQRTYEQPQQRSYSQPSYSAPSAPSYGGGGGGHRGRD